MEINLVLKKGINNKGPYIKKGCILLPLFLNVGQAGGPAASE